MDDKGVYIGTNNFTPGFSGTSLFTIPKADLFDGDPSVENLTRFDSPLRDPIAASRSRAQSLAGQPRRERFRDDGQPRPVRHAVLQDQRGGRPGCHAVGVTDVNAQGYTFNGDARQPDVVPRLVDTLDDRVSANAYEVDGKVYGVHTVTPTGGAARGRAHRTPVVRARRHQRCAAAAGRYRWRRLRLLPGRIAVNQFGQAVIGYNRSGFQDWRR